jgi:hypothetical protein
LESTFLNTSGAAMHGSEGVSRAFCIAGFQPALPASLKCRAGETPRYRAGRKPVVAMLERGNPTR